MATELFVGRETELNELLALSKRAGPQFLIVYGRRRVGKTTLLLKWSEQSGLPTIYWNAVRGTPATLRQELAQAAWRTLAPDVTPPTFDTWEALFENVLSLAGNRRLILIMDEFPWAMEADPSLASRLQNAWDHLFKKSQVILALAGSHIGMMSRLFDYQSALYGRFTAQLSLKPLPFAALPEFLPRYDLERCIAVYAVVGGVPAYLERIDDRLSLAHNMKREIMSSTAIFRNEPFFLLSDQVREPRNYIAVIRAIGRGAHVLAEIATETNLPKHQVAAYLDRLQDLQMVERRLPATLPPAKRARSHQGRYHLLDHYHRFHFRFLDPNLHLLEQGRYDQVWTTIQEQFRAFIGASAFEELCREWIWRQADRGQLSFTPEIVGSHWGRGIQVDVAALNWRLKAILLGEAKWGTSRVSAGMVREFLERASQLVTNEFAGWQAQFTYFARAGFTEAARQVAAGQDISLIGLDELGASLVGQSIR